MKHTQKSMRKSSALLAAGAGAAVCLTGGGAQAVGVTGSIVNSNGTTNFGPMDFLKACNSLANWFLQVYTNTTSSALYDFAFSCRNGYGMLNQNGSYARAHNGGVVVSSSMPGGFADYMKIPAGVSNKYFAVRYGNLGGAGVRYGWLHVKSTTANTISLDKWGYEFNGGTIKTLADSIKASSLALSDGRVQLHWTNANEEGVARYEVQAKDASGAWNAVSSEVPGAGMYSIAVPAGSTCRVVVEKVDGTTEEIGF